MDKDLTKFDFAAKIQKAMGDVKLTLHKKINYKEAGYS